MEEEIVKKIAKKYNKKEEVIYILLIINDYNVDLIKCFFELMQ